MLRILINLCALLGYRWREIKSEARNDPEKPVTFDEIVDCMLARYESHTDEINHDNLDIETSDKVSNHTTGDLDSSEINTITSKRTHSSNDKKNSLVEKTKEGESDSDTDTDTDLSSSSSSSSSGMKMRQAPIIIHSSKVNSGAKDVASEQGNSSSLKKDNRKSKKKKMKKKNGRYDGVDGDAMDSEHNLDSHPKIKKMKRIKNHDGSHDKKTSRMKGLTNIKIKGYTSNDESLAKDNIRNGTTIEVGEKRREKKEKKMKKKKKEKDSIDQSSITSPPIKSRLNDSSARIISSQSVIELSSKKDKKRKWEANEVSNGSVVRGISLETLDDDRNRKKHKNKHHKRNK